MFPQVIDTPMSRRTALAALAGFLPWPKAVLAHTRKVPAFSFVVVSDTHLGREDKEDAARQWTQTAREINAAAGEFVLHLGDVVDGGREAQYEVYKDIRKAIRKPVHEIPGNHDPHALFAKHLRQPVDFAFDHEGVRFLLLNNSRTGSVDGFITPAQVTWLAQQSEEAVAKGLFLILALHVAVHANKPPDPGFYVKPENGQQEFYTLLSRHKDRVLALLHGHFHCGLRGWDDHAPLHEVIIPSALFNRDYRLTAQKAPGYNLPEFRPGFVLTSIGPAGMTLRYKPVGVAETRDKVCPLAQFKS
jgi:3',5'-cyclic-AMP phosphodiesterase